MFKEVIKLNEVIRVGSNPICLVSLKEEDNGNSLVVQRLGLRTFTAGAQVQSLVGELRSLKPCRVAKNK